MTQSLQEMSIPQVEINDVRDLSEKLGLMAAEKLPAFVMHEAGFSLRAVINQIRPILVAEKFGIEYDDANIADIEIRTNIFSATATLTEADYSAGPVGYDAGFHFDKLPTKTKVTLTTHLTTKGEAKVRLIEPTTQFFTMASAANFSLAPELSSSLRNGTYDPEYLQGNCYTTDIQPGSLLVFRLGGLVPLVHDFETTLAPRGAEIGDITHSHNS